jgi:hypothetical protein
MKKRPRSPVPFKRYILSPDDVWVCCRRCGVKAYGIVVPDRMAGLPRRYTVYAITTTHEMRVVGRELPLRSAKRVAQGVEQDDGVSG